MTEILGTISTVLLLIGVYFNARKKICGFYFWLVGNPLCLVVHFWLGSWSMMLRDLIFIGLAIYGICQWRRKCT